MTPAMSVSFDPATRFTGRLSRALDAFDKEADRLWQGHPLAA